MEWLNSTLDPLLEVFAGRPWVQSALVAVLALLAAYILTAVFRAVFGRLVRRTQVSFDDQIIKIIRAPLFYSILVLGLSLAVALMPVGEGMQGVIYAVFKTVGIVVWSVFLVQLARILLRALAYNNERVTFVHPQTLPLFENIVFMLALAISIYMLFEAWDIDMTAWMASAGVVGIAVGFAAKDTLSNLISGIFILADAPYKIGDYVVLDGGERGEITHIGIRSTRMLTRDDVELTVPNAIMGNTKIINESGGPHEKFRIRIPAGVAYGSDIDQVRALLMEVAINDEAVCDNPEPRVRLRRFGESSLDFELMCWVDQPALRGRVIDALLCEIYKKYNAAGIEIPYAKRDVYIREMP